MTLDRLPARIVSRWPPGRQACTGDRGWGRPGVATAKRLAGDGARITIADIDEQAMDAVAEQIRADGGQCETWRLDLSEPAALAELQLEIDVLVNNAAIQFVAPYRTTRRRSGT